MEVHVDSDLEWRLNQTADCRPLIFEPSIDWEHFAQPNIIHDY